MELRRNNSRESKKEATIDRKGILKENKAKFDGTKIDEENQRENN